MIGNSSKKTSSLSTLLLIIVSTSLFSHYLSLQKRMRRFKFIFQHFIYALLSFFLPTAVNFAKLTIFSLNMKICCFRTEA